MTNTQNTNPPLERLFEPASKIAIAKLQAFKKAGAHKIHYLFDFDRTITSSDHVGMDLTIWDLLDNLLPAKGREDYDDLTKKYQVMENAGKLSDQDAMAWWALSFELYIKHEMNINQAKDALGKLQLREGALEIFKLCEAHKIPTTILSAGIGDIIEMIAVEHGMKPSAILSTRLKLAQDGRITGWDPKSVVHVLNKQERGHNELQKVVRRRPFTVLVGDSTEDVKMIHGTDSVLRVRVGDNHRIATKGDKKYLQESFNAGFDIVMGSSLRPLVDITNWIIS